MRVAKLHGKKIHERSHNYLSTTAGMTEMVINAGPVVPSARNLHRPCNIKLVAEPEPSKSYRIDAAIADGRAVIWLAEEDTRRPVSDAQPTGFSAKKLLYLSQFTTSEPNSNKRSRDDGPSFETTDGAPSTLSRLISESH